MKKLILMGLGAFGVLMLAGVAFLYFTDGGLSTKLLANGDLQDVEKEPRSQFLNIWALAVQEAAEPTPEAQEAREARKVPNAREIGEAFGIGGSKGTGGDTAKPNDGALTAISTAQAAVSAALRSAVDSANDEKKAAKEIGALAASIEAYAKAWEKNYPQLDRSGKESAENGLRELKNKINKQDMTGGYGVFSRFLGSKGQDGLKDKLNGAIGRLHGLK